MSTALSFPELRSAREGAAALPSSSAQDNVSMTAQYPDIQAPEPVQSGDWSEVMLNYEIISKESLKASGNAIDQDCVTCSTQSFCITQNCEKPLLVFQGIVVALNVFLVLGLASLLATAIVKGRLLVCAPLFRSTCPCACKQTRTDRYSGWLLCLSTHNVACRIRMIPPGLAQPTQVWLSLSRACSSQLP